MLSLEKCASHTKRAFILRNLAKRKQTSNKAEQSLDILNHFLKAGVDFVVQCWKAYVCAIVCGCEAHNVAMSLGCTVVWPDVFVIIENRRRKAADQKCQGRR